MKKIFLLLICVVAGLFVGNQVLSQKSDKPQLVSPSVTTPTQDIPVVKSVTGSTPIMLRIPKINVAAQIESVGMDSKGRMDVPRQDENAAWYNLGFKPGEKGSAVIDGHFDKESGQPAVFYKLSSLKPGDTISITNADNQRLNFTVQKLQYYDFDKFPLQEVFNTTDKPRLNLITCDGVWSTTTQNYSKRLVVYSELASSSL